jgi:hypothetical protein
MMWYGWYMSDLPKNLTPELLVTRKIFLKIKFFYQLIPTIYARKH